MAFSCLVLSQNPDLAESNLLIGLRDMGVDIRIVCATKAVQRPILESQGIEVLPFDLKGRFDKAGVAFIKEQLAKQKPAIVYAFSNNSVSNGLTATKGVRCVFVAYRGIEGNVSYFDPMSWTTYLHPRVEKIVCVADAIRRYFHNMHVLCMPLPVTKAVTIHKGHDPAWYSAPAVPRADLGIPSDALVVGCTVNYRPRKGIEKLIAATHYIDPTLPIYLVLIGSMPPEKLQKLIDASPMRQKIVLTGYRHDAPAVMGGCDICVLPALKREGLPRSIIEGMIQGVAPIVTDSGGSPELVEEGVSGLIIPPGSPQAIAQSILKLYNAPELLESMKAAAKERIRTHFHTSQTVKAHYELFDSLLKSNE